MPRPELSEELQERIRNALAAETNVQLAALLGVSIGTVRKYREQGRRERRETAQRIVEDRVQEATPTALDILSEAMQIAAKQMRAKRPKPAWVKEARESAKAVLSYVGLQPEVDPLQEVAAEALLDEVRRRIGGNVLGIEP